MILYRRSFGNIGILERKISGMLVNILSDQGPVSRKSRELFGPGKPVVKPESARFEKLIF